MSLTFLTSGTDLQVGVQSLEQLLLHAGGPGDGRDEELVEDGGRRVEPAIISARLPVVVARSAPAGNQEVVLFVQNKSGIG